MALLPSFVYRLLIALHSEICAVMPTDLLSKPVVAVGGLGGSGTRVIGYLLQELQFYLGPVLNPQLDNILFTLLFKRRDWFASFPGEEEIHRAIQTLILVMHRGGEVGFSDLGVEERSNLLHQTKGLGVDEEKFEQIILCAAPDLAQHASIGWKEPNTHVFLPQLSGMLPQLKYIHVMRHGLDMALSQNQQQLVNWGGHFGITPVEKDNLPNIQLKYWLKANHRAIEIGKTMGPERFLLLRYDSFCQGFDVEARRIEEFLGKSLSRAARERLAAQLNPTSLGRYRAAPQDTFSEEERASVAELGFDCAT